MAELLDHDRERFASLKRCGMNSCADQVKSQMPTTPDSGKILAQLAEIAQRLGNLETGLARLEHSTADIRQLVGPFGLLYPDGTVLVQTLYGTKYFIDASDMVMAPQLVIYRQWEPEVSQFFLGSIGPDTVFMDVGANIGYFTCLLASYVGRAGYGRVIAVEACPRT